VRRRKTALTIIATMVLLAAAVMFWAIRR